MNNLKFIIEKQSDIVNLENAIRAVLHCDSPQCAFLQSAPYKQLRNSWLLRVNQVVTHDAPHPPLVIGNSPFMLVIHNNNFNNKNEDEDEDEQIELETKRGKVKIFVEIKRLSTIDSSTNKDTTKNEGTISSKNGAKLVNSPYIRMTKKPRLELEFVQSIATARLTRPDQEQKRRLLFSTLSSKTTGSSEAGITSSTIPSSTPETKSGDMEIIPLKKDTEQSEIKRAKKLKRKQRKEEKRLKKEGLSIEIPINKEVNETKEDQAPEQTTNECKKQKQKETEKYKLKEIQTKSYTDTNFEKEKVEKPTQDDLMDKTKMANDDDSTQTPIERIIGEKSEKLKRKEKRKAKQMKKEIKINLQEPNISNQIKTKDIILRNEVKEGEVETTHKKTKKEKCMKDQHEEDHEKRRLKIKRKLEKKALRKQQKLEQQHQAKTVVDEEPKKEIEEVKKGKRKKQNQEEDSEQQEPITTRVLRLKKHKKDIEEEESLAMKSHVFPLSETKKKKRKMDKNNSSEENETKKKKRKKDNQNLIVKDTQQVIIPTIICSNEEDGVRSIQQNKNVNTVILPTSSGPIQQHHPSYQYLQECKKAVIGFLLQERVLRHIIANHINNRTQDFPDPITSTLVLMASSPIQMVFCEEGLLLFKTAHLPIFPYTSLGQEDRDFLHGWLHKIEESHTHETYHGCGKFSVQIGKGTYGFLPKKDLLMAFVYLMLNQGEIQEKLIQQRLTDIIIQRFLSSISMQPEEVTTVMEYLWEESPTTTSSNSST